MSSQGGHGDFYQQLFEEVSDAIFVYNPATDIVGGANPAAMRVTATVSRNSPGTPVTQFSAGTPEEVERAATQIVDRAADEGQRFAWQIKRATATCELPAPHCTGP